MVSFKHEPSIFVLDNLDIRWTWKEKELIKFRELWDEGLTIEELAKEMKVNQQSIALLAMDQESKELIQQRRFGLWGN